MMWSEEVFWYESMGYGGEMRAGVWRYAQQGLEHNEASAVCNLHQSVHPLLAQYTGCSEPHRAVLLVNIQSKVLLQWSKWQTSSNRSLPAIVVQDMVGYTNTMSCAVSWKKCHTLYKVGWCILMRTLSYMLSHNEHSGVWYGAQSTLLCMFCAQCTLWCMFWCTMYTLVYDLVHSLHSRVCFVHSVHSRVCFVNSVHSGVCFGAQCTLWCMV